MDLHTLQARIDRVESKRTLLQQYQADPNLRSLAIDIEQALIEMDDLKIEFQMAFPNGIFEPPLDRL